MQSKNDPTIEENVVIHAGASILGGDTLVGHDSVIGPNVSLTKSVLPNTKVVNNLELSISPKNKKDIFSIQGLIGNTPLVEVKNIFKS